MVRFTDDRVIFAVGDAVKLKHQMEHSSGSDVQNNKLKLDSELFEATHDRSKLE